MDSAEDRSASTHTGPRSAGSTEARLVVGRVGGQRGWLMALVGVGLFLAGALLGGILALSLALYREPAGPPRTLSSSMPLRATPPGATAETKENLLSALPTLSPTPITRPVGPKVGWEAPDFALHDLNGTEHSLAYYRGRTVLLHFWASWCLPCRAEWPELLALVEQHGDSRFVLLAVNSEEPAEAVRHFVGPDLPPFPVLLDSDGSVGRAYRLSALPTTFVIGQDGIVQSVVPGNVGAKVLEELLEE